MKKILITGVNSYIGNSFAKWLEQYPNDYSVDKVSVRDDMWKELDLSIYDSVLHLAGIAHRKETKKNAELYYKINRDLTYEVAKKAKKDGVKQFIFFSTMSVYGLDKGVIDKNTSVNPKNNYGKSKLQAEKIIESISDNTFKVCIIRPPMIYGKDCKGNYQRLRKLALKTPIFPEVKNKRSMIYVDNLSECIRKLIDNTSYGLYCPQNKEYVNTSELVKVISKQHDKKIILTNFFNLLLRLIKTGTVKKVFGDLVYDKSLSKSNMDYQVYNFFSSIEASEKVESESNGSRKV